MEFDSHIKCVSEAEKYMGALYHEPGKREGAKQDKWLDDVRTALDAYQGPLSSLVARLKQLDNIPRKEKAFIAFAGNSLGMRDEAKCRALWTIIAPTTESSPAAKRPRTETNSSAPWKGFEEESRVIMSSRGNRMQWKILRDLLAKRHMQCHEKDGLSFEDRQWLCLSELPVTWAKNGSNWLELPPQ